MIIIKNCQKGKEPALIAQLKGMARFYKFEIEEVKAEKKAKKSEDKKSDEPAKKDAEKPKGSILGNITDKLKGK